MSSRWSLKRIGRYFYLYSFEYKPVHLRKKREKDKRFVWKYRGKYSKDKTNKFINSFAVEIQNDIHKEYEKRVEELKELEKIAKKLELKMPYSQQKNSIFQITELRQQHNLLRKFERKLLSIAKGIIERKKLEKDDKNA